MTYVHALRSVLNEVSVHRDIEAKGCEDNHLWLWTFPSALIRGEEGKRWESQPGFPGWELKHRSIGRSISLSLSQCGDCLLVMKDFSCIEMLFYVPWKVLPL